MLNNLLEKLKSLSIPISLYTHEPLYTVQEALKVSTHIPGAQCKNLFLKDSKKKLWLVVAVHDTVVPLKKLSKELQAPELRFADAALLKECLGVEPGAVTPFGIIYDTSLRVTLVLDASLFTYDLVCFHPLQNDHTVSLPPKGLLSFIEALGHSWVKIDFSTL